MKKKKVLFLCTGNSCRSQMAEGWLRKLGGKRYEAMSAGIEAHGKNPQAIAAMADVGVDISDQQSKVLTPEMLQGLELLVTVCGHADGTCPAVPVTCKKVHWPFDDPTQAQGSDEEVMAEFRRVRNEIWIRVDEFVRGSVHMQRN